MRFVVSTDVNYLCLWIFNDVSTICWQCSLSLLSCYFLLVKSILVITVWPMSGFFIFFYFCFFFCKHHKTLIVELYSKSKNWVERIIFTSFFSKFFLAVLFFLPFYMTLSMAIDTYFWDFGSIIVIPLCFPFVRFVSSLGVFNGFIFSSSKL